MEDATRLVRLSRRLKGHPVNIGIARLGGLQFGCAFQAVDRFGVSLLPDEREAKGMMSRRGLGVVRDRLAQNSLRFRLAARGPVEIREIELVAELAGAQA